MQKPVFTILFATQERLKVFYTNEYFSSLLFGELSSDVLNFLQSQQVLFEIQRCAVISEKTSCLNVAIPAEQKRKSPAIMLELTQIDGDK